jgi:hypothetical protein
MLLLGRQPAHPNVIYSSTQVSDVLLTLRCRLISVAFQTFSLLIPETFAGFTSYVVHLFTIFTTYLLGSNSRCNLACFLLFLIFGILRRTMAYASSVPKNLEILWLKY